LNRSWMNGFHLSFVRKSGSHQNCCWVCRNLMTDCCFYGYYILKNQSFCVELILVYSRYSAWKYFSI